MKKIIALAMAAAMAFALMACGGGSSAPASSGSASTEQAAPAEQAASADAVVIKLGHGQTETHPYHLGAVRFKELVEQYTEGRVKVEIYPNATLGPERDMVEGCTMNTVGACITTNAPLTNFDANFNVYEFPYLFESREEAHKVMDSEFGANLMAGLEEKGLKGLAYFENGFRNITNGKHEINTVEDLAGLKIRTMESTIHIESFKAMGANPTPMAWGEVYTALQQGTIDGQENPAMAIVDGKIYEVNPYLSKTEHFYSPAELVMSLQLFNQISPEDQEAVLKAADEAKDYQREEAGKFNTEKFSFLEEQGVKITEVDKSSFIEASSVVYDQFPEYADAIKEVLTMLGR